MADLHSQKDIEKISYEILKGSKSLDVFPTPVDNIVSYSNLLVDKGIDVSQIHPSYIEKASDFLKSALTKVRGILIRPEKTIYLDFTQNINRQNFVKLHEVGHSILPWQKDIHEILGENDDTLSSETREEFEIEANYFASITLFQLDRFEDEIKKLELGLKAVMAISKNFGASFHATIRRYVEVSKKRCALIVLENISERGTVPKCSLRDFFESSSFKKEFGRLVLPSDFGYTWPFAQDYYQRRKFKEDGEVEFNTQIGKISFQYHFFNNTFNAFVFIFPIGEHQKSRTKIIITGQ